MKANRRKSAVAPRWGFPLASRMGFVEDRILKYAAFFFMGGFHPQIGLIGMAPIALPGENICLTLQILLVLAEAICTLTLSLMVRSHFIQKELPSLTSLRDGAMYLIGGRGKLFRWTRYLFFIFMGSLSFPAGVYRRELRSSALKRTDDGMKPTNCVTQGSGVTLTTP